MKKKSKEERLYWACFERQNRLMNVNGFETICDSIEFNGRRIGIPLNSEQQEIESDEDAYVLAPDIAVAIELFIRKAKERLGGSEGFVVEEVESPWMMIEFTHCPYVEMAAPFSYGKKAKKVTPLCQYPEQHTLCAITVRDGRADSTIYPMSCVVCETFRFFYDDDLRRTKLTKKEYKGVSYYTLAI